MNKQELAKKILDLSIETIMIHYRFFQSAIDNMPLTESNDLAYSYDIEKLNYNYMHVILSYQKNHNLINRQYMHILLHAIFSHPFVDNDIDQLMWDSACDIAVENVINSFDDNIFYDDICFRQSNIINMLDKSLPNISAERIYNYFKQNNYDSQELLTIRENFYVDDHQKWYQKTNKDDKANKENSINNNQNNNNTNNKIDANMTSSIKKKKITDNDHSENKEKWKNISKSLQVDLETFAKNYGKATRSLIKNLKEVNEEKVDYQKFLKKFLIYQEEIKVNMDEFDYIYYNYGLELYHNIPLIEPLEYAENKKIKQLVIAIDTSGSITTDIIKAFLSHTFAILNDHNTFFKQMEVYIIQCDCQIQDVAILKNEKDVKNYIDNIMIKGLGGTDFRPVFSYIKDHHNLFNKLKGLLYFTDGDGIYPNMPSEYQTIFILYDQNYQVSIPDWIIKTNINERMLENEY